MQKSEKVITQNLSNTLNTTSCQYNLKVNNLSKYFGDIIALKNISFEIRDNKYLCIIGASGSGKTTLLRIIAGLEDLTTGSLFLNNINLFETSATKRNIAMVFQDYALFPHMTVYDNIGIGLKIKNVTKSEIKARVNYVSNLLNINHLLDRKPRHISGGEQQRVALGRAIIKDPDIFLLDEPLANLDSDLKINMRNELKKLQKKIEKTFIHVTHDQFEAFSIADLILLLDRGEIKDFGTPDEVYSKPLNIYSAKFIGFPKMNFLKIKLKINSNKIKLDGEDISLSFNCSEHIANLSVSNNKEIILGIRPEAFSFYHTDNFIKVTRGKITNREVYGSFITYLVNIGINQINIIDKHSSPYHVGDVIDVYLNPFEINYFDNIVGNNLIFKRNI